MSGQRKNYNKYHKQLQEYVKKHPPYAPSEPCNMDLRAFAKYVKENGLSNDDITPEIVERFTLK